MQGRAPHHTTCWTRFHYGRLFTFTCIMNSKYVCQSSSHPHHTNHLNEVRMWGNTLPEKQKHKKQPFITSDSGCHFVRDDSAGERRGWRTKFSWSLARNEAAMFSYS